MMDINHWGANEWSQSRNKEQIPSSHTLVNTGSVLKQVEKAVETWTAISNFYLSYSESILLLGERGYLLLHLEIYPCSDGPNSRPKARLNSLFLPSTHLCGIQINTPLNAHFSSATASVSLTGRLYKTSAFSPSQNLCLGNSFPLEHFQSVSMQRSIESCWGTTTRGPQTLSVVHNYPKIVRKASLWLTEF